MKRETYESRERNPDAQKCFSFVIIIFIYKHIFSQSRTFVNARARKHAFQVLFSSSRIIIINLLFCTNSDFGCEICYIPFIRGIVTDCNANGLLLLVSSSLFFRVFVKRWYFFLSIPIVRNDFDLIRFFICVFVYLQFCVSLVDVLNVAAQDVLRILYTQYTIQQYTHIFYLFLFVQWKRFAYYKFTLSL